MTNIDNVNKGKRFNINKQDFVFLYSNQRSGHHAILHWVCSQAKKRCVHINGVGPNLDSFSDGKIVSNTRSDKRKNIYNSKLDKDGEIKFINLENKSPEKGTLSLIKSSPLVKGKNIKNVIILRDFFNFWASFCKVNIKHSGVAALEKKQKEYLYLIENWKKLASLSLAKNNDFYTILYNNWVSDKKYRKAICNDLKLNTTDIGFDYIPNYGGGSSFGSENIKKLQDDVNNRYSQFINKSFFYKFIDDEIRHYQSAIFNLEI